MAATSGRPHAPCQLRLPGLGGRAGPGVSVVAKVSLRPLLELNDEALDCMPLSLKLPWSLLS